MVIIKIIIIGLIIARFALRITSIINLRCLLSSLFIVDEDFIFGPTTKSIYSPLSFLRLGMIISRFLMDSLQKFLRSLKAFSRVLCTYTRVEQIDYVALPYLLPS